eukprot:6185410-Pleurochrysis_carterae.AAC.2
MLQRRVSQQILWDTDEVRIATEIKILQTTEAAQSGRQRGELIVPKSYIDQPGQALKARRRERGERIVSEVEQL